MRTSEWIQVGFAVIYAVAAWVTALTSRPLPVRRRWIVTALAAFAVVADLALRICCARFSLPDGFLILLDCLTVALFLVPYWQTGQFFLGPSPQIQERLLAFDRRLLPTCRRKVGHRTQLDRLHSGDGVSLLLSAGPTRSRGRLRGGLRGKVDGFWLVLLISTYLCYAITPFVPAFPPRSPIGDQPVATEPKKNSNKGRIFNRWILQHGSIHAISFPSAHVASAFAIAFVLLFYSFWIGDVFLLIAIMISLGAVIGRYHYALDVLMGAVTALVVFLVSYRYLLSRAAPSSAPLLALASDQRPASPLPPPRAGIKPGGLPFWAREERWSSSNQRPGG